MPSVDLHFMGADPSLRYTGWCRGVFRADGTTEFYRFGLIKTKKSKDKKKSVALDDFDRCAHITTHLEDVVTGLDLPPISLILAEAPAGSQNARAAKTSGLSWGVLSTVSTLLRVPCFHCSPGAIKKALVGRLSGSKKEIEKAFLEKATLTEKAKADIASVRATSQHEHMYDAGAAVLTLRNDREVVAVRRACGQIISPA